MSPPAADFGPSCGPVPLDLCAQPQHALEVAIAIVLANAAASDIGSQPLEGPTVALIFVCLAPVVLEMSEFVEDGVTKKGLGIHKAASFARVPTKI